MVGQRNRLEELQQGRSLHSEPISQHDDIETGLTSDQDAVLAKFNREAAAIDKVHVWAEDSIRAIKDSIQGATTNGDALKSIGDKLNVVEEKLGAVRKRLKRIAGENKELSEKKSGVPSSLRIRVSRYTKLGKDFMAVTSKLEATREAHKEAVTGTMKQEILAVNPSVSETQVDRALESGSGLESVLESGNSNLRYQIEDLQSRNRDIQKLSKSIVDLHQMFTDMGILVEGQQELINNIEYNVEQVKTDTKKGAEELVVARKHQKSARKKKMCICIIITIVLGGGAAGIIIWLGLKNGWFSGGDSNDTEPTPTPNPTPSGTVRRGNHYFGNPSPDHFEFKWRD